MTSRMSGSENVDSEAINRMNNQCTEIKNLLQEHQNKLISKLNQMTVCCPRLNIWILIIALSWPPVFMLLLNSLCTVHNSIGTVPPQKCYAFATGEGLKKATAGERATVVLHVMDLQGKTYIVPDEAVVCELAPDTKSMDFKKINCSVQKNESGRYEISYQPTSRGRHQLHIKEEDEHIIGSPFSVIVLNKLSTPTNIISGVAAPQGIAFNENGDIFVAEYRGHSVSVFCPSGEKLRSFGSKGSGYGQFNHPCAVAVDDDGNVLVADGKNHRIQKFTPEGK